MATEGVPAELERLVEKMYDDYTQSELDIALALAEADDPLSVAELADETGYTDRTIKKRVGTLEEQLRGPPLIDRDEDDRPYLHPAVAEALRAIEPAD